MNKGIKKLQLKIKSLQRFYDTIKLIDTKYQNKFIHISNEKLTKSTLFNTADNTLSWIPSEIYHNPKGLWVSCGSDWLRWVLKISSPKYHNPWINYKYIYEITINYNNILYIKNYDELIAFHIKYAINDGKINWKLVKKEYDGLIICPYLGYDIWNEVSNIYINNKSYKHITNILSNNILKYPQIYLEWYRHWETGSGVIWRKKSITKITEIIM